MKKVLVLGAFVLVAALIVGVAGFAYAQAGDPPTAIPGFGPGMMGDRNGFQRGGGMMGQARGQGGMMGFGGFYGSGEYGPLHEYMITALADGLGLEVEDLEARLEAGETPYQVAQAQGLDDEAINALFQQAHEAALTQAVADGVITQEQADWMIERMGSGWANGFGPGRMGGRGRGGSGYGMMGGFGQQGSGLLHDYQIAALADGLGLTAEELQARIDGGETVWQIAEEKGLSAEEFQTLKTDAHALALEQAVADGVITQEQADWMNQRMGGRFGGAGGGFGQGGGFGRGGGFGQGGGFGPCHGSSQP